MGKHILHFAVRPVRASQLDLLERKFDPDTPTIPHYLRYAVQSRGEGVYLVAWRSRTPLGYFLLRWRCPDDVRVTSYLEGTKSAFLETGATRAAYRRQGIATALIREAEYLAKEHGCSHMGVVVGTGNSDAKRLYEQLGYRDWGRGAFRIRSDETDRNGQTGTDSEVVTYLCKPL
jgi:GNAT superfamily N-acetyltransferase